MVTLNAIVSITSLIINYGGTTSPKAGVTAGKMDLKRVGKKYLQNKEILLKKKIKSFVKSTIRYLAT